MLTSGLHINVGDVNLKLRLFADVAPLLYNSGRRLCSTFVYPEDRMEDSRRVD